MGQQILFNTLVPTLDDILKLYLIPKDSTDWEQVSYQVLLVSPWKFYITCLAWMTFLAWMTSHMTSAFWHEWLHIWRQRVIFFRFRHLWASTVFCFCISHTWCVNKHLQRLYFYTCFTICITGCWMCSFCEYVIIICYNALNKYRNNNTMRILFI